MDLDKIDEKYARWLKPLIWVVAVSVVLILYVFAYPAVIVALENKTEFLDDLPAWGEKPLKLTAAPLVWMDHEIPAYEAYVEWLETIF